MKGNCVVTSPQSASTLPSYIGGCNTAATPSSRATSTPSGFCSPLFVIVDRPAVCGSPAKQRAIGRLRTWSHASSERSTIPTASAIPYDLVVDQHDWILHVL